MSLAAGTRLGPYEITSPIGAGGMGEVYKARDTRLDRTVAIKILPPTVAADPERRARFAREAKTIAGLNHPHICALHDVGEHDGTTYLVMEHLTGETLAQRLDKGPLPVEQALTVATEIADALAAAHRQGVIHRDLKPGNVMLTKSGAKLLDFGLAKLKAHGEQPAAAGFASAPTQSTPLTAAGAIVGTLQYMAPEQIEGKPADARTDLWALGGILHETVTGKRAFEATSAASLITAIMGAEPPALATLQPLTPPGLDRLVRRCLAKDPDGRWQSAADVADELQWLCETSRVGAPGTARVGRRPALRRVFVVAAGLALLAAGAGLMWLLRPSPAITSVVRTELPVRPAETVDSRGVLPVFLPTPGGSRTALTWTPDGESLVFVGRRAGVQQLFVRRLDGAEARPLANTEGAQAPAVSADGQWVAFWADGAIRRVPLAGGPAMDLVSGMSYPPMGLVWDGSSRLFCERETRVWTIPTEGTPAAVTTLGEAEQRHILPWPLPGGETLLYTVRKRSWSWGDEEVVAQNLASGARKVLLKDAADARYLPSGHLVFLRRGQLFAVAFDAARLELRGGPVAVLDGVAQALTAGYDRDVTGAGQIAVAPTGTLAWLAAPPESYPDKRLVTVDRQGRVSPLPAAPMRSYGPVVRVSPDGRRLAVTVQTLSEAGVWVYDMARGTSRLLAGGGEAMFPIWSPDGQRLVFDWLAEGQRLLAMQPADATTVPQKVAAEGRRLSPSSFTPDGRRLAIVRGDGEIVVLTVGSGEAPVPLVTPAPPQAARWPEFSPDGHWLAYASDVSGRFEVYVRPYPGPGPTEPVSLDGGWCPAWNPTGRELFFLGLTDRTGKIRMMAVEFVPGSPPRVGRPRQLFEFTEGDLPLRGSPVRRYDVAPDGQRFYAILNQTPQARPVVTSINLVQNWFEELKAKVPTGR